MANATQAIEEFVALSIDRRRGKLPLSERPRLEALEDVLRDMIDGAHAAPRKLENPSAAGNRTRTRPEVAPAKIQVARRTKSGHEVPSPAATEPEIKLSSTDEAKVTSVKKDERPSGYTPSVQPCFLGDYYNAGLSLAEKLGSQTPTKIRSSDEEAQVQLGEEARLLLGLKDAQIAGEEAPVTLNPSDLQPVPLEPEAIQAVPAAPAAPQRARRTSTTAAPTFGPSNPSKSSSSSGSGGEALVTIQFIAGGSKRGTLQNFDPSQATLQLVANQTSETITLRDALAIFFQKSSQPIAATGSKLVVTLINDRELGGVSPDYAPGVAAMHIVPNDQRGQVQYIWVPAWAVKAIRFA